MIGERIQRLRKARGLHQIALATILNTTQQTISKIENERYNIPIDILIQVANYFNVTTDYLLGRSDIKRDIVCQIHMNKEIDQHYDLLLRYKNLNDINKKTFHIILERLEETQLNIELQNKERDDTNVKNSNL